MEEADRKIEWNWRRNKLEYCENPKCNFVALDSCQLDIHLHREAVEDQITLCANCHRLVTWIENKTGRAITRRDIIYVHPNWGTSEFERRAREAIQAFC